MDYNKEYLRWLELADQEAVSELKVMDNEQIKEAFCQNLSFGTGGLRGIIGAGTNRMNVHTVGKASQGLANYVKSNFNLPSIAISYDSRIKSVEFAKKSAAVFAANGIKVYIYPQLMPTPCLSYAVRALSCSAGIMVTASHNPSKYNGYKVYDNNGCQITTEAADEILASINKIDIFKDVCDCSFEDAVNSGNIKYIEDKIYDDFIAEVKAQSVLFGDEINRDVAIVYSPLNGAGLKPVTRILNETGFTNITVVEEQENPDGNFPTCPYPNPEIREAMQLGIEYCKKTNADLLIATDPDCDRCGIAVKNGDDYQLLTGNEVGLLLLDYICYKKTMHSKMPQNPVFVKTIVTTDLAEKIANHYSVQTIDVLTGFKFIGEVIGNLEKQGRSQDYLFGFEESYGYLTGAYVRDKDAVNAAYIISEMFAYYKTRNISLLQKLDDIYQKFGYCLNTLHSYNFEGISGMVKMKDIMQEFRKGITNIANINIENTLDYSKGIDNLPISDVLKFVLPNGSVVVRPSGTEPKLKIYISITASNKQEAMDIEKNIKADIETKIKKA